MSDCEKCWSTPCCCGYEYKDYTIKALAKHISSVVKYRSEIEAVKILKTAIEIIENIHDINTINTKKI